MTWEMDGNEQASAGKYNMNVQKENAHTQTHTEKHTRYADDLLRRGCQPFRYTFKINQWEAQTGT